MRPAPRYLLGSWLVAASLGSFAQGGNVCECWTPHDATWTLAMPPNDSQSSGEIFLPFTFNLYGDPYTSCYINNNGNVSFGGDLTVFAAQTFPLASNALFTYAMVAPYWEDVDTELAGEVWYKLTPTALYVNWEAVGYYDDHNNYLNSFSVVITDGNDPAIGIGKNVRFCYQDMQWTSGDAFGNNGFGSPGTVGANRGNGIDFLQIGTFDHPGVDYDGPFNEHDGISWLDDKNFTITTEVFTSNVPPIGSGTYLCDTVVVCAGEPVQFDMQFLSPEATQITSATATAPTLSNFAVISNTPGQTANITVELTPLPSEAGYHLVTFEATDSGDPPPSLTSTYNIVVEVQLAALMEPGDTTVCETAGPVDLYALLGGSPLPGGEWTDPDNLAHSGVFVPGVDPDGEYVYAVSVGGNCPNVGVVTMTTIAQPDAGADGAGSYCSSDPQDDLFQHLGGTPAVDGAWLDPNGGAFSGTLQPGTDVGGDYLYVVTGLLQCPSDTAVVTVAIQSAVDAGSDAILSLCTDATAFLLTASLNGTPETTGSWTAPGGGAFGNIFDPAADAPGVYTYTVIATAPCITQSSALTMTIDQPPGAGGDAELTGCMGGDATDLLGLLTGSPDPGGAWIDPLGSAHSGMFDPTVDTSGTYTYVVQGPGGCAHLSDSAVVLVAVNPLPVITFVAEPDSGCAPLEVTFHNTTDAMYLGGPCEWLLGDGTVVNGQCDSLVHEYEEPGWYNVRLSITTPEGCTDQFTLQGAVLVEPPPTADFDWSPDIGTIDAPTILFFAEDPNATVFAWDIAGLAGSDQRQVAHTFPDVFSDEYEVCLGVADRYGCTDSLCQTVSVVIPLLYVPNAFSPNGDGWNEVFVPVLEGMVEGEHELLIFDRWGQLVFETPDATQGWDGRHANGGDILPTGVYTWRLVDRPVGSSDKKDWFGTVTLLK